MPFATDDLTGLFVPPDREFAGFAQGVIRTWNGETFENSVEVRGGVLRNLPVASGVEALTYQSGDVVMLVRWKPRSGRGSASYWIGMGGRVIFPAAGAAQAAIAWMRGSLATQISAEVFAERVHQDFVGDSDTLSNQATFTDLSPAGPTIGGVDIAFGTALVFVSCSMAGTLPAGADSVGGFMGVEVSGDSTVAADIAQSFHVRQTNHNAGGTNRTDGALAASMFVIPGLNAGTHAFTAKYRTLDGPTTTVQFSQRTLAVIGL